MRELWTGLLRIMDTVVDTELHMRHGIQIDLLPDSFTWHQLGSRMIYLYRQRDSDTRREVRAYVGL